MNKVVINCCYGGFGLSEAAEARYDALAEAAGVDPYDSYSVPRHCPILIAVIEEMGAEANGSYSALRIVEIEGNKYRIDEYDGYDSVVVPESQTWITIN